MKTLIDSPIIIFSVFQSHLTESENLNNHKRTLALLQTIGTPHKVLQGVYKGERELSILVLDTPKTSLLVRNIASQHNQESILSSDQVRDSKLLYVKTGEEQAIGRLTSVKQAQAIASDCYTFDSSTGQYWVTV